MWRHLLNLVRKLQAGNGLYNLRDLLKLSEDFVDLPVHDDVSDVGRVAPLPHVGRAGLLEVSDRRGLDVDLGRDAAEGGDALSPGVFAFIVAETAIMSNG